MNSPYWALFNLGCVYLNVRLACKPTDLRYAGPWLRRASHAFDAWCLLSAVYCLAAAVVNIARVGP